MIDPEVINGHIESVSLEAQLVCEGEQLAFIEAICEASHQVTMPQAKLLGYIVATMALGGSAACNRCLNVLLPFIDKERFRKTP